MLLSVYLATYLGNKFVDGEFATLSLDSRSCGNGAGIHLILADDEHVGNLGELRLSDPVAELLVSVVELNSDACRAELL